MRFFVDNNLSPQLAKGLKAFGEDVVHLQEIFPENAEDPEWLARRQVRPSPAKVTRSPVVCM